MFKHWKRCEGIGSAVATLSRRWLAPALLAVAAAGGLTAGDQADAAGSADAITSVPLRTAAGETLLPIQNSQPRGAKALMVGKSGKAATEGGIEAINRAIIPLNLNNASLLNHTTSTWSKAC